MRWKDDCLVYLTEHDPDLTHYDWYEYVMEQLDRPMHASELHPMSKLNYGWRSTANDSRATM